MKKANIHVLIVLGRIGRYFGDKETPFLERIEVAKSMLDRPHRYFERYDQVHFTGGPEVRSPIPNAELLRNALQDEISSYRSEQVTLDWHPKRNQVALIEIVDAARECWPRESIHFDIVTSSYAEERMKGYMLHHIAQLTEIHEAPSPRQLYWIIRTTDTQVESPLLNRVREKAKKHFDLRKPDPVPLVRVN